MVHELLLVLDFLVVP
jgi:hypothetical protein